MMPALYVMLTRTRVLPRGVVFDELPVVVDAEARVVGDRHRAVVVDGADVVRIVARVHRWNGVVGVGVDQREFVVVRVARRGEAVALGRPGRVELDVEAEPFGHTDDLHRAGDARVVLGVGADEVRRAVGDEVRVRFQAADVFGLEDGGPMWSASFLWPCWEMPPSRYGSSYQKKPCSSQAFPTFRASAHVSYSRPRRSTVRSMVSRSPTRIGSAMP